jgi:metallo-beta-lactamase class B
VRTIRDGETLTLGNTTVTARATPGHDGQPQLELAELRERSMPRDRLRGEPEPRLDRRLSFLRPGQQVGGRRLRRGQAAMRALPCDILVTAHADQDSLPSDRYPPGACRAYALSSQRAWPGASPRSGAAHA